MNALEVRHIPSCSYAGGYVYRKAEKIYGKAYQVFINIYGAYSIAKDVLYLPPLVHDISKTIGYIGVVDVLFAGPRLVTNITDFIHHNNFYTAISATLELTNVLSLATEVLDACKDMGFLAQDAYSWTNHMHYAFLPSQFISLKQSVDHLAAVMRLGQNVSLRYVNEHAQDIQHILSLSKKCLLKERSGYFLGANTSTESQSFLMALRRRIHIQCLLACIDTISTLASSILSSISLIIPTTPLIVALYTATCVASLAYSILEALFVQRTLDVVEVKSSAHDAIDAASLLQKAV